MSLTWIASSCNKSKSTVYLKINYIMGKTRSSKPLGGLYNKQTRESMKTGKLESVMKHQSASNIH